MFTEVIDSYFGKLGKTLSKSFTRNVSGIISATSISTYEIARHVCKANGKDFNTNERTLNYLLSNQNFQIDDNYWRMHIKMIFNIASTQGLINENDNIYIQVDFTSNKDNFLILCASIIIHNKAVPIYFTMRNYPRTKNQFDQKKMESAFLRGLQHVLSKKYNYIIVADRGFGNKRFIEECEKCDFKYIIRSNANIKIKVNDKIGIMEEICNKNTVYEADFINWEKKINVYKHSNKSGEWYLLSSIDGLDYGESEAIYQNRFKIEKCFQDLKSSGFDIEESKIRKYANYKRLIAMCMVAHALLVLLGNVIISKGKAFLKNSADSSDENIAYLQ